MKVFYTLMLVVSVSAGIYAQTPQLINYQAVIRDVNSTLVRDEKLEKNPDFKHI